MPVPLVLLVGQVVAWFLLPAVPWHGLLIATGVLTVLWLLVGTLVVPGLRYRLHRWEVTEDAVYTRSGWLVREWRIAPIPGCRRSTPSTGRCSRHWVWRR